MTSEKQHWSAGSTYYGWCLFYDPTPGGTRNSDGTTSFSVRFPAFKATEYLADPEETVRAIADALNQTELQKVPAEPFQARVSTAHHALFHDDPTDVAERSARYFEESGETCQALGMTEEEAIALVRYTWSRPAGDPAKEIGSAALTLASLCIVAGYDMMACAEADLEKLLRPETIERIRAKRATRHGRGPLPGFDPTSTASGAVNDKGSNRETSEKVCKNDPDNDPKNENIADEGAGHG